MQSIPLRNIFYMLAYAWNRIEFAKRMEVGQEVDGPDTPSFFARVLCLGCRQLLRRGLDRSYIEQTGELSGLRGKLLVTETMRRDLIRRGKTICVFDELSYDAPHNRLLKSVLVQLAGNSNIPREIRSELKDIIRQFDSCGVRTVRPSPQAFRQIQLHRNNAFYGFLLQIAEFLVSHVFPEEGGLGRTFAKMLEEDAKLEHVFESFVRNFYRAEQSTFQLRDGSERLKWDVSEISESNDEEFLPGMYPDITLRRNAETIVMDAKYYRKTFSTRLGSQRKLHSSNLYQLFSYLKNMERRGGPDAMAQGILLYPQIADAVSLSYKIQGHVIRICTVNLGATWNEISTTLLSIIGAVEVQSRVA